MPAQNTAAVEATHQARVAVVEAVPRDVRAYYLKEAFQRFWDYKRPGWSEPYLKQWLWWASHSRLKQFTRFAKLIREHLE